MRSQQRAGAEVIDPRYALVCAHGAPSDGSRGIRLSPYFTVVCA